MITGTNEGISMSCLDSNLEIEVEITSDNATSWIDEKMAKDIIYHLFTQFEIDLDDIKNFD